MASVKGQVHRGDTTPLKSEVQELRSFGPFTIHDSGKVIELLRGLGDVLLGLTFVK